MNIGIMVAVEFDAFYTLYGEPIEKYEHGKIEIYKYNIHGKNVFVANSSAGQIRATIATTLLLELYKCDIILNYGVVGALSTQDLEALAVVENVVYYEWDTSGIDPVEKGQFELFDSIYIPTTKRLMEMALEIDPKLEKVNLASGEKFVDDPAEKQNLKKTWNCDIVDMEGAGIAITCHIYGKEFLMIKAVSDTLAGGANEFLENLSKASRTVTKTLDKIIEEL